MFSLFEFAIGVGLLVFIVFVACVYGGMLCLYIWDTAKKIPLEACFCDALFNFYPPCNLCCLARFLLWIKCLDALLMLGHFCLGVKDSRFMIRKFHPFYQDEVAFVFF